MKNVIQAKADFTRSWQLDSTFILYGWMIEWSRMCQDKPDLGMAERLEMIPASDPHDYWIYVCRGAALWLRKHFEKALIELEQSIQLDLKKPDAYFWKGMVCAALGRDEEAMAMTEKALELELPPVLLAPLRWLEQERPDFYQKFVRHLLACYDLTE